MAKGQKRSNREAKKPKADKKKTVASSGLPGAAVKPKPGAARGRRRKGRARRRCVPRPGVTARRVVAQSPPS